GSVGGPKINGRRSSPGAILAAKTLRSTTAALCFSFWLVKNEGEGLVITERSSAKSRQRGRCREGGVARAAARLNPRRFGWGRESPARQLAAAIVLSSSISAARLSASRPIVSTANLRPLCR